MDVIGWDCHGPTEASISAGCVRFGVSFSEFYEGAVKPLQNRYSLNSNVGEGRHWSGLLQGGGS